MTPLLEVEGLSRSFGGVAAASNIDLTVGAGEICSVIGPNGAGKTTLFNLISGVLHPSAGRIRFQGKDITGMKPWKFAQIGIARTFQNLALFSHGTVIENILVGRHIHMRSTALESIFFLGRARREEVAARRKAEEIVDFLEIEEVRNMPVGALSYGLQKRVELGRALACEPKLLLLDEIVAGMNREETEDIARFILDIREELGIPILMVEHDMQLVMDISDHIHVLNFGRKIAEGTPAEIKANPHVINAYLGEAERGAA